MSLDHHSQAQIATLLAQGNAEAAQTLCLKKLAQYPDNPQLWYLLGSAAAHLGCIVSAIEAWESARAFAPENPLYTRTLASAYLMLGQREELMISVRELLQQAPESADTFYLLGAALQLYGSLTDAEAALRQALYLTPNHLLATFQLGQLMLEQGKHEQAIQCFESVLTLSEIQATHPAWLARVWSLLGQILQKQGQLSAAAQAWMQALELWPDGLAASGLALQLPEVYPTLSAVAIWREKWLQGLKTLQEEITHLDSPLDARMPVPYALAYQGQEDRELLEQAAACYSSLLPTSFCPSPLAGSSLLIWNGISPLWEPALIELVRLWSAQTELQILTACSETFARLNQAHLPAQWLPPHRESFRQYILNLAPKHLFYADLRDSLAYSLALERLAAFQGVFYLQPETSGLKTLDAFFSMAALEPEHASQHYTERLITLQNWPIFPLPGQWPTHWLSRRDLHFAELAHIYLCPVQIAKVHPAMDTVFEAILSADRRAVIYLLYPCSSVSYTYLQQRLQETVAKHSKIRFLPCDTPTQLLQYIFQADVVLDSPYFGGRTSMLWSLASGVPVVTWPGPWMRGRWAATCNQLLGLEDLNAQELSQLAEIACAIASDRARRAMLRKILPARVRALWKPEAALLEIQQAIAEI